MSDDATSARSGERLRDICPMCHQPCNISSDSDQMSQMAASAKRQQEANPPKSSHRKKLRSSDSIPDGKFTSPFVKNCPVFVHVYYKDKNRWHRRWVPGIVDNVYNWGDGEFSVAVKVKDNNGDWVYPRTIHKDNQDPIPSKIPGDDKHNFRDYIVTRDEGTEALSQTDMKFWQCIKYHSGNKFDAEKVPEEDIIGKAILNEDPDKLTSMRNLVRSLQHDKDVTRVVNLATGGESCSAQHALAYLVGQFCGIELSETSNKDIDAKGMLDQIGSNDNVLCPTSQVFLMSAMSVRTKTTSGFDPTAALYDYRGKRVLSDPEKLKTRLDRLRTALAALHSSQNDRPSLTGPAFALLSHGVRLMIDMRGTSDDLLDKLSKEGVCRPARVLRVWIQKLAEAIDPIDPRSPPPPNHSHVLCWTGDNADYHLFQRCLSVVPVGNILLGIESTDDTTHFNKNYMSGLGKISDIQPESLRATSDDDEVAQDVIENQNIAALLSAATGFQWLNNEPVTSRSRSSDRPTIGSQIAFKYRSEEREGKVTDTSPRDATVEFVDGGRLVTRSVPLASIDHSVSSTGLEGTSSEEQDQPVQRDNTFAGKRYRFPPTSTSIASVLTGLSSKNNETARQLVQEIINRYGEEKFYEAVHIIVADQEFMPTIINDFFSKLGTGEELPIIPALAIGHAMKGLSVSMMSYYRCFMDPMLEELGIKVGSPEHERYYKGNVIRKTNRLVTNFTEMLAVSAAHLYLSEVGKDLRVNITGLGDVSPNSIISGYYAKDKRMLQRAKRVTVLDPNMRPRCITVTDSLKSLAKDFQSWVRRKWGTDKRVEVGPSGYQGKSSDAEPQLSDPVQQELSERIEQEEKYKEYRDRKYADDGDTPGLLTACQNAGLILKSSRKDKDTLSKKLFLHEVEQNTEGAKKFGPARKVPEGTNSTGLAIYDLIFGVERYAIVQGHLLTRIRPKDTEENDCERYPRKWLVFFKALTASNFMRRQPNYQRLSLSFLIQLTMILNHKDPRCRDLALKRLRLTMAVGDGGDSHNCTPVDLLQENSMVKLVKNVGRRDPTATRNLEARSQIKSYMKIKDLESKPRPNDQFGSIYPENISKAQDETRMCRSIAHVWLSVLRAILPVDEDASSKDCEIIQGIGDEQSKVLFADRSKAFYRTIDATDHILVAGAAFLKGLGQGCEVAIPARAYGQLPCLDRPGPKKKANNKSPLSKSSKKMQLDAKQSLTQEGHVIVSSSSSILDGNSKCGEGKARIYPTVISTMSDNKPYTYADGQIGDGPSKPVVLARTQADASNQVINRSKREEGVNAIIQLYIDIAKDLRRNIPKRNGEYTNSVNDLARDIICQMVQNYHFSGVELICLTMDVAEYMTILRVIPHAKRGKMEGIKLPHGSLSRLKRGDDDLTAYGARSDLLTCGDQHFIELLFNCISNQARLLQNGKWKLHRNFGEFALAVVGGSPEVCVVVGIGGKQIIRLNTKSITVSCKDVEEEFEKSKIVKIEEGEMMVYAAMRSVFKLGFTHKDSDEGLDCIVVIHSDDSDAFAGIGMQVIYNLESTCIVTGKKFLGAVYIQGPRKSVTQLTKLGNIFTTNFEFDQQLCPTGRGFFFLVDMIAVYYRLEQDKSLPQLPGGHRAITAVSVAYTLINHDYLKMAAYGLTYKDIIATLKSSSYKKAVKNCDKQMISAINYTRRAIFAGQNHNSDKGYNLPGILILFHHAFMNRSKTKKFLVTKYKNSFKLDGDKEPLSYNIIRAAAILAGEMQPLPDPVALLAHISCANQIFRRWSIYLYNSNIRTDDELKSSCYIESEVKGRTEMSVEYSLNHVWKDYRPTWTDDTLQRKLRQSYGCLLPSTEACASSQMPFNPLDEIRKALELDNEGLYPSVKVLAESLPPLPEAEVAVVTAEASNAEELEEHLDDGEEHLEDGSVGSDDRGDSRVIVETKLV